MIKKYSSIVAAVITLSVSYTEHTYAQMVGTEAYIKGNYVEIGVAGAGGHEGANTTISPNPTGMHPRSGGTNFFGFVANPQMNGWATSAYDGDFFTPGSPENGWGLMIDTAATTVAGNNCNGDVAIPGMITSYSYAAPFYSVDWEGDDTVGTSLHVKINYLLNENDLFYTTTVWITNNTAAAIPHIYFYRNVDPDNNESLTGNYSTHNTIVDQAPAYGGSTLPIVSAAQYMPFTSYFAFIGDTTFKAGYGGFSNRNALDMFNGTGFTQTVSSSNLADEAIYLASDIQNLLPSDSSMHVHRSTLVSNTRSFSYLTLFDSAALSCAIRTMHVTQAAYPELSTTGSAITLLGNPAGGTFTGTGVIGNTFDPMASGAGTFDVIYSYTDSTGCTANAVSEVHVVDLATGIAANTMNAHVSLYPNPFTDETTISVGVSIKPDNASVHIYDVLGNEVKIISAGNSNEIRVDRKGLAGGMYFYKLINNNQQIASGKMMIR